jgi:hypothetical protein
VVWKIESPRFVIEELTEIRQWQRENEAAAYGSRWLEPSPEEEAASVLEARLYGWLLYNRGEMVARSHGGLYLQDCESMVAWMNGPLGLDVEELWNWKEADRPESPNHEWVPVQPFFEVWLSHPNSYHKTTMARWLLVNAGHRAAGSTGALFRHECLDFVTWLQDETGIPVQNAEA